MPKRKKKKHIYDPVTSLQFMSLLPELEEMARTLYELSCAGSKPLWSKMTGPEDISGNIEFRKEFPASSHAGMSKAQAIIVDHLRAGQPMSDSHHVLFRSIADAIGWQLINMQLCYARRFYKGHDQPSIGQCNFDSAVFAAENHMKENPGSVALISDLTSFVQVGDLLTISNVGQQNIIEVKEGDKNKAISGALKFYSESGCDRFLQHFMQSEGPGVAKQMGRMARQIGRMAHVVETMTKGISEDPDEQITVNIPDAMVVIEEWQEDLQNTMLTSKEKGWAINVIDGAIFIGCYSEQKMRLAGHIVFNGWFDQCGGTSQSPRTTLLSSLNHPLALPIFNMQINNDLKFDSLFGRIHVCIGFSVDGFLSQCEKSGLKVRSATNKEAAKADQVGQRPYRHNGKAIFVGDGKNELMLMDGIFLRAMHHFQRPVHLIKAMLLQMAENPPNKAIQADAFGAADF